MSQLLATALNITLGDASTGELEPLVEAVFILENIEYAIDVEEGKPVMNRIANTSTVRFTATPASCRAAAADLMKFADIAEKSAERWQLAPEARESLGGSVCEQLVKWVTENKIEAEALDEELDDMVHGVASKRSTDLNNAGTDQQIDYLLSHGMTAAEILTHINKTLIEKES